MVQRGNKATSSTGGSNSAPPKAEEGSLGVKDEPPPTVHAEQNPTSKAPRVVDDANKITKESSLRMEIKNPLEE